MERDWSSLEKECQVQKLGIDGAVHACLEESRRAVAFRLGAETVTTSRAGGHAMSTWQCAWCARGDETRDGEWLSAWCRSWALTWGWVSLGRVRRSARMESSVTKLRYLVFNSSNLFS